MSVSIAHCPVPGVSPSPTVSYLFTEYYLERSGTFSDGFGDFLSQYPNLDEIGDLVKLSMCMLVFVS